MARFSIVVSILIFAYLFAGCANQVAPSGGPQDKTPPTIVESTPRQSEINYKQNSLELTFSKYMDKRSVKDAIFVSPPIEGNLDLNWSGKTVTITFPTSLKENTTYVFAIGTDALAYYSKVKMTHAFALDFSTGNEIDRRQIIGRIFGQQPEGSLIFAYKYSDSVTALLSRRADYISQVGSDGFFNLRGIAAGKYLLFAVKDDYRSLTFNADQSKIGVPPYPITIGKEDTLYSGLNFQMIKMDTVRPRLMNVAMTDKHHLSVSFSEPMDSSSLRSKNFYLMDSISNKKYPIVAAYRSQKNTEQILVIKDSIPEGTNLTLIADSIADISKNYNNKDEYSFLSSQKIDTIKVFLKSSFPLANNEIDFKNSMLKFVFNKEFDSTIAKSGITLTDTLKNLVDYDLHFVDNASFNILPKKDLDPNKYYQVTLDYRKFKGVNSLFLDSTYTFKFKTKNGLDFTGCSGSVLHFDISKYPVLVLENINNDQVKYTQVLSTDGKFNFQRVEPARYKLWLFYDSNKNNKLDLGSIIPFNYAEEFFYYNSEIMLRPRWQQTDISFDLKPPLVVPEKK